MRRKDIAVILEASGFSTRFGSNKLLNIMEDGRPMADCIFDAVRSAGFDHVILVTQYEELASLAGDFRVVMNQNPEMGISHTMQLGIEAAGDADAYMFCVCDQPYLTSSTLRKLAESYISGNAGIVSLSWNGRMYNPKIFSSEYREELMAVSGDTGGRQIISAHRDELALVEADSEMEIRDIDYKEDK